MSKPLIGITCSSSANDVHAANPQDRLNCAYSRAVALAGGIPVLIPNVAEPDLIAAYLGKIDGLMLSGGYDLEPMLFGEDKLSDTVETDPPRDRAEIPLIGKALKSNMPILAICRGIQSLNVALGGSLFQDIPIQITSDIIHRQPGGRSEMSHAVKVSADSTTRALVQSDAFRVNSFHHQAIKGLGRDLIVTARAEDGIVEAVEIPGDRFVVGVQWHPEELVHVSEEARNLFQGFVAAAARLE